MNEQHLDLAISKAKGVTALGDLLGVSRQRVFQIRQAIRGGRPIPVKHEKKILELAEKGRADLLRRLQ